MAQEGQDSRPAVLNREGHRRRRTEVNVLAAEIQRPARYSDFTGFIYAKIPNPGQIAIAA
jgi:hypothetical protein